MPLQSSHKKDGRPSTLPPSPTCSPRVMSHRPKRACRVLSSHILSRENHSTATMLERSTTNSPIHLDKKNGMAFPIKSRACGSQHATSSISPARPDERISAPPIGRFSRARRAVAAVLHHGLALHLSSISSGDLVLFFPRLRTFITALRWNSVPRKRPLERTRSQREFDRAQTVDDLDLRRQRGVYCTSPSCFRGLLHLRRTRLNERLSCTLVGRDLV